MERIKNYLFTWGSILLIPVLLIVFAIIYYSKYSIYMQLLDEDQIVEWLTFGFLFLTGLLSLIIAKMKRKHGTFSNFFLVFGIIIIFLSFEEISWGQRIIGLRTPTIFLENSDQPEINLHNIIQEKLKNISFLGLTYNFKTKHVVGWFIFFYGTCLPLLALWNNRIRNLLKKIKIIIPHPNLSLGFLIAALMMLDKPTGVEEELGEFFISINLFLFIVIQEFRNPELGKYFFYFTEFIKNKILTPFNKLLHSN
jgi:hypothetical protein